MKTLKVEIDFTSVAGVKPENQDACAYYVPDVGAALEYKGATLAIADGVSASERAREASNCAVNGFVSDYYTTPESWSVEHSATKVISALNSWMYSQSVRQGETSSMLSTLSILIIKSNVAHVFHVGDSRIYRLRGGVLTQLTNDHVLSVNQEKTYLSRAMGFDLDINVDYKTFALEEGDQFLLTTDGVHDYLDDNLIEILLNRGISIKELVDRALDSGSQDNISAAWLSVRQLPEKNLSEAFDELSEKVIPPDLQKGMKINGFEIESLIQSSAKMQLYLARDLDSSQQVALKTPSVNFEDDPLYLQHFSYEKWVGKRVQNPHVVKVISNAHEQKFLAYALEYVKGQTLKEWIGEHPNPEMEVVVSIIKQTIQGIRGFHRQEMIHGDLKPENIMIDNIGQVKIVDFGSVSVAGIRELNNPIEDSANLGSVGYTAPEVILNQQVSRRSDQFSLGVVVYEMLSGQLPYSEKLNKDLSSAKLDKIEYCSLLNYQPDLPVWIDGAIHKACHLDPERRYESLSEFLYDLQNPNPAFTQLNYATTKPKQRPLKYYLLLSFALNLILLLLLVIQ